jgi:mRNA-degrading endonuclease YafQ of YafQ-DinJ toxin-antitoxin module
MWRIGYSETFARTCRKVLRRNRALQAAFASTVALLEQDPHHPRLKLHPLHGELDGLFAARVTYSVRLVLILDDTEHEIILIDIGSHDEAYR